MPYYLEDRTALLMVHNEDEAKRVVRAYGVNFSNCKFALPNLKKISGWSNLCNYEHPLPEGVEADHFTGLSINGYDFPLPKSLAGDLPIPVIPMIDAKIEDIIDEVGGTLDMAHWHGVDDAEPCGTTHCRAGWAIYVAGKEGFALEHKLDPATAGALIYEASRPGEKRPNFFCDNGRAMADIRACAARQRAAAAAQPE